MEQNERWKIDGDCRLCRRSAYCSKPCKLFNRNLEKATIDLIQEKMGIKKIMDIYDNERMVFK